MWDIYDPLELSAHWQEILKRCEAVNKEAAALLYVARPVCIIQGDFILLYLSTKYAFHQRRMMSEGMRQDIERAFARFYQRPVALDIQVEAPQGDKAQSKVGLPVASPKRERAKTRVSRYQRPRSGNVRSIPTEYNGVEFRSRLEANTAKIFDDLHMEWHYEVDGYDLDGVWYLPDFWLPESNVFVETKGILDAGSEEKVQRLCEVSAPKGIGVVLLFNIRPRAIDSYLTVAGDWVLPHTIEKDGALILRCPSCKSAYWARRERYRCPLCNYVTKKIIQSAPVFV